jgi:hypothetical protein
MATPPRLRPERAHVDDAVEEGVPEGAPAPTPEPTVRHDWRLDVVGASGVNVLVGLWLIVSPVVLDYSPADHAWNPMVFGAIVALIAFVRVFGAHREAWLSLINMLIGGWVFASGFLLAETSQARWNSWVFGAAVVVLALISATASERGADLTPES